MIAAWDCSCTSHSLLCPDHFFLYSHEWQLSIKTLCNFVMYLLQAARYILHHHPCVQLVVVGPVGDATGAAASAALNKLRAAYPGRVFAPLDYYAAGEEKTLLLTAADFLLAPSRCGLGALLTQVGICLLSSCRDSCCGLWSCCMLASER